MTQANRSRGNMLTRILLVLCLILGPLLYLELELQDSDSPDVVGASEAPAAKPIIMPQDAAFAMSPLEDYSEVLARPPFSQSRRPAPPGVVARASEDPLEVTIIGTILGAGSVRALIEHGEPAQVTRVFEGQEIDGWTVKTILQDKVTLVRGAATVELKVKGGTPATPPTPSTSSASVPAPPAPAPPMPAASIGTQRLARAGALSPSPAPSNATARRAPQAVATAALASAQSDAGSSQVVNPDALSPALGGSVRNSMRRR